MKNLDIIYLDIYFDFERDFFVIIQIVFLVESKKFLSFAQK